ncbi:MAG: TetR/AcrR family transcriptional regulator [Actinobacteria bacterium]|nr:TetR/AcrR family transcriptional regulator [Actinomycetota bacterium]
MAARPPEPRRSHSRANRRALVRAVADLLTERGLSFSLTDVAERAGTSVATSYRHLVSQDAAIEVFVHDLWVEWSERMERASARRSGRAKLEGACLTWVKFWLEFRTAALVVRPTRGVLERHRAGDEDIARIWGRLEPILQELVAAGEIPRQPLDYAVLLWVTLLNERVVLDLHGAGWSARRIAAALSGSLMAALQSPPLRRAR